MILTLILESLGSCKPTTKYTASDCWQNWVRDAASTIVRGAACVSKSRVNNYILCCCRIDWFFPKFLEELFVWHLGIWLNKPLSKLKKILGRVILSSWNPSRFWHHDRLICAKIFIHRAVKYLSEMMEMDHGWGSVR